MSTMNPKSFARLMKLLDLAAVDIAQALYVSPSHVSRWKTGSRELKTSRSYFEQLEELFLSVNAQHADGRMERFLLPEPADRPPEEREALMRQRLRQFLIQPGGGEQVDSPLPAAPVQVLVGLERRIEALKQFFEHVLTLNPKPDIYLKEVLYASWCPRHLDWFSLCHEYALRYMDAGGVIYYFSNLNNLDRATFYSIWKFTSHKNLYPGYSANMAEESPACAYYLAEGTRSVMFYAPEDQPKSYITTVCSDPLMLSAQEHYLKNLYEQRQHQIFIDTVENHTLLLSLVQLHQKKAPPLLFAGKFPSFLLLKPESLRELLRQNHVADEMTNYCVKFQRVFQEQFQDPAIRKTFFYYQEDLLDFAAAPQALDTALTALTGKPVFVSRAARRELLVNLRSCCGEDSPAVRIVSKENVIVHDALGDAITLWVKRGDWYLIFYPGDHTDARLIIDSLACTLRYDLYYSTLLNVPAAPAETAAFLSRAISILDEGTATI